MPAGGQIKLWNYYVGKGMFSTKAENVVTLYTVSQQLFHKVSLVFT